MASGAVEGHATWPAIQRGRMFVRFCDALYIINEWIRMDQDNLVGW
jgi:hypothetical protein